MAELALFNAGTDTGASSQTPRKVYEKRWTSLEDRFNDWRPHFLECSDYILPRRGQFLTDGTKPNKGGKLNGKIIDSSATFAARTLSSGLMGGLTSPARPWFKLETDDLALREFGPVKEWLNIVERMMLQVFATSNLYRVLPTVYETIGVFGTGAMTILDETLVAPQPGKRPRVIRCQAFPIGSFRFACGDDGSVDSCYRRIYMTVGQLVQRFGEDNVSTNVLRKYNQNDTEELIEIQHVIEPNDRRIPDALGAERFPIRTAWFEVNEGSRQDSFLFRGGFPEQMLMGPRWWVDGDEDVYGRSPGMDALGDAKQLQFNTKRKAQALDKIVDPPMQGPGGLKHGPNVGLIPGAFNYVDDPAGMGIRPVYEVPPQIAAFGEDLRDLQRRISRAFHEDLFLMLANTDRREITAREVEEKHEEKLLQLGPVLERLEDELLDPIIDRTFAIMLRARRENGEPLLPPVPEELAGQNLGVEYISILAQAQRSVGTTAMDRYAGAIGQLAQLQAAVGRSPDILDKLDFDQFADEQGRLLGVPAAVIRSDDAVEALRQGRAQQERQKAQMAMAQQAAETAKTASEASLEGESVLSRVGETARDNPGGVAGATGIAVPGQ